MGRFKILKSIKGQMRTTEERTEKIRIGTEIGPFTADQKTVIHRKVGGARAKGDANMTFQKGTGYQERGGKKGRYDSEESSSKRFTKQMGPKRIFRGVRPRQKKGPSATVEANSTHSSKGYRERKGIGENRRTAGKTLGNRVATDGVLNSMRKREKGTRGKGSMRNGRGRRKSRRPNVTERIAILRLHVGGWEGWGGEGRYQRKGRILSGGRGKILASGRLLSGWTLALRTVKEKKRRRKKKGNF